MRGCQRLRRAAVFVQLVLALRYGRNWAAQWHLARAVGGKCFRGCRAKRFYSMLILPRHAAEDMAQDVVQDEAQDVAQDVAKHVLGAAEEGA